MVAPYNESQKPYSEDSIDHAELPEDGFAREGSYYMAYYAEGRKNEDVYFWMAKEPEEVLKEERVTARGGIIKGSAEVAVSKEHCYAAGKDGYG